MEKPTYQEILQIEAELIAPLRSLEHANALFRAIEAKEQTETTLLFTSPRVCNEDIKQDWRYKLGFLAALSWVGQLPEEAQQFLEREEQ